MSFSISVVIPAYNCEGYIEKAIISALIQPEVLEIIVVNDGSTDDTQAILYRLITENQKVKVFYHKDKLNKGRSASRNLGIKKATGDFIAFLDADDYYLPNRFFNDKNLFEKNKEVDGVYNAVGFHYYQNVKVLNQDKLEVLSTVSEKIKPEDLFETLFLGKAGHFHIDGLTLKKRVFSKIGLFNEALKVAEDTDVFWKMALKCRLETGIISEPLALRGIHGDNVFNRLDLYKIYRIKMYESLLFWSSKNHINKSIMDNFLKRLWILRYNQKKGLFKDTLYWFYIIVSSPKNIFSYLTIKYFPVIRLRKKLFSFLYKNIGI